MSNTVILIFDYEKKNIRIDIEVPLNISANELIYGLNKGLMLGINTNNTSECYLCTKEPRALLRGDTLLEEYGLRDGTIITFRR
ncbi:MAG: hypothetical protein IJ053_04895 [Lachnospiraceae bacterium]|nr:hypothetical protein [Lachnospiraceae bacterium]